MPGPILFDPTPDWLKPQNRSVFDSPMERVLQTMAGWIGADDPRSQALGMMNPTPVVGLGLVPRQSSERLMERLATPSNEKMHEAIAYLAKRFPRLMSHVAAISPQELTDVSEVYKAMVGEPARIHYGRMYPTGLAAAPDWIPPGNPITHGGEIAALQYDPMVNGKIEQGVDTLSHELTHAAQALRQTDRARRVPGMPTFGEKYEAERAVYGYRRQPMETRARANAASETQRFRSSKRVDEMSSIASKVLAAGQDAAHRLRTLFPDATEREIAAAVKQAQR